MPQTLTATPRRALSRLEQGGFLCVHKPSGITSFDVIRELRRSLRLRKMGHSGVLDRPAEGLLVVGVNQATRLFELFSAFEKEYRADIWLGLSTSTDDLTGELIESRDPAAITREQFMAAAQAYLGSFDQVPPAFSLTKLAGRELYRYALAGKEVEAAPKRVELLNLRVVDFARGIPAGEALAGIGPLAGESRLAATIDGLPPLSRATVEIRCRGGFYVRSLARDCGRDLGVLGTMGRLTRTRVGPFSLDQAITLGQAEAAGPEGAEALLLPLSSIAPQDARLALDSAQVALLRNGRAIKRFRAQLPPAALEPEALLYGLDEREELIAVLTLGANLPGNLVELRPVKVVG